MKEREDGLEEVVPRAHHVHHDGGAVQNFLDLGASRWVAAANGDLLGGLALGAGFCPPAHAQEIGPRFLPCAPELEWARRHAHFRPLHARLVFTPGA